VTDLVIAHVSTSWLSSSRFNVDLPATGAQSVRSAASLPTRTASSDHDAARRGH
jgi:hypothetical protein